MAWTALSAAAAGFTVTAAWLNLYLRDNVNYLDGAGGKAPTYIIAWYPASVAQPDNWFLCDSTYGTLDLRDKQIIGAGSTYAVGATGGAATAPLGDHSAHVITIDDHWDHVVKAASNHAGTLHAGVSLTGSSVAAVNPPGGHFAGSTAGGKAHTGQAASGGHVHTDSPYAILAPWTAKYSAVKGIPTLSLTAPRTWADGNVPTAAQFNVDLRDNIKYLRQQVLTFGAICAFNGSLAALPSGWQNCDGTNGTPDMRDRFMFNSGPTYVVDATGGAASLAFAAHANHTVTQADTHTDHPQVNISIGGHTATTTGNLQSGTPANEIYGVDALTHAFTPNSHSAHSGFTVNPHDAHAAATLAPPYLALAYIQFVSGGNYTTPRTWADGELVDAGRINTYLRDNLSAIYSAQVPIGAVFPWHDAIGTIPANYNQLDGSGGRYDSRNRLIVGAGSSYAVGATGGATTVTPAAHAGHGINVNANHAAHSGGTNAPHTLVSQITSALGGGGYTDFTDFSHDFAVSNFSEDPIPYVHLGTSMTGHSAHDALAVLPPYMALALIQRTS